MRLPALQGATAAFDAEMIVDESRPLNPAERKVWQAARRKPEGRPKKGAGVKAISLSVV